MKPINTLKRLKNLILHPLSEWELIKDEQYTKQDVVFKFALPLILFASLATFLGGSVVTEIHTFKISLIRALISFASFSLSIYVSALTLNQLLPKFETEKSFSLFLKTLIYSFSIFIISAGIADIHVYLKYFNILGVYSLILLWMGVKIVIGIPSDKVAGFAIISFLFTIIIYTLFKFILSLLLLT